MTALVVDEAALGPADAVFVEAERHLARRLGGVRPLDPATLPVDRREAVAALDAWAGDEARNWRGELERWYEAHAPVLLRPDAALNALVRRSRRAGVRIAVVSALPHAVAELYLAHLGLRRVVDVVVAEEDGASAGAARDALGEPAAATVTDRAALEAALTAALR